VKIIRTVLGDIEPPNLGLTLGHDHLMTHPPEDVTDTDLLMDDLEAATRELELFKRAGGGAVVEMTTVDYGRDAGELEQISRASGVHVIAATGFNKGVFADRLTETIDVRDITNWMANEVNLGITRLSQDQPRAEFSRARAGIIKASSSLNGANKNELVVLEAAAQAHLITNAPISTHTEKGTWALGQIDVFQDFEVHLSKVLIGHLDLKPEWSYLLEVAKTGVNIGFDQFGKEKYLPDLERVNLIVQLCEAGFETQIIIGGDMARKSYFKSYGGNPGLEHVPITVKKMLAQAGLSSETIDNILIHNPRRWLEFEVSSESRVLSHGI
jgi:5-phospho-D-xylono-1,4-lactonase